MKICFIVGSFPYMDCGVGDYTSMVATSLAEMGHEVSVITGKKAENTFGKVDVHNIIENFDKGSMQIIVDEINKIQPEIVHFQYPSHGFNQKLITSILLPKKIKKECKNVMLVETVHEFPEIVKWKFTLPKSKYLLFDRTIFVEEFYETTLKKKLKGKFKKANTGVINIGSNIPKSKLTNEQKEELKQKLGLQDDYILSYFGFARPNKGIEDIFNAIKMIDNPRIKLLYIGEIKKDNEYQNGLLQLINELNIEDRVVITGYKKEAEEVADYLAISDVCVLPYLDGVQTRYGSFLAACTQNVKVITTSLNNAKDEDGIYYVKPSSPNSLADKIREVIYLRDVVSSKKVNDWKDIAEKYIEIYNNKR